MDKVTKEQRSKNMRAIRNKDTDIELLLRKALWHRGYRYRKNYKFLEGKPDIVFLKFGIVVFCDSEFWHGYNWQNKRNEIKSNKEFWYKKIEANIERDKSVNQILENAGWKVIRFWANDIKNNIEKCITVIEKNIKEDFKL